MGRGDGHQGPERLRRPARRGQRRGPQRWSDQELERELLAFLAGRKDWPTNSEFTAADRTNLAAAVSAYGGARYWAARLGCRIRPAQDRRPYSEEELVAEARLLIARYGRLPGIKRLQALGHGRLATAVRAARGSDNFSRQQGLL